MAAETVIELPFTNEEEALRRPPSSHLEIEPQSRQRTEVYHGRAKVSRLVTVPYTMEMPQDYISSDVIDINVNGLAAAKPSYRAVREAEAQLGKNAVSLGVGTAMSLLSTRNLMHPEQYHVDGVVAVVEDLQKHFGQDVHVRLKGHSKGGRTATGVAEQMPEVVDSVTYVNAAGLEEANILEFTKRIKGFIGNEIVPNWDILRDEFEDPKVIADFFWYNFGNPLRFGIETASIVKSDIRARAVALGDLGIKVAILDSFSDRLVPNKTVKNGLGRLVDVYRMHPNKDIGHLGPQAWALEMAMEYHDIDKELHPEEILPARLVAVRSMARGVELRRADHSLKLAKAS